ncbi:MAG: 4-alpha-glucanotransferase [Calditrichia bacterium]
MNRRGSGILMHISSLPSEYGIGDLGPAAYKFVDFLRNSKQSFWQVLPLNPTSLVSGNSPYASFSAFAGNTLFISPDLLNQDELLTKEELLTLSSSAEEKLNFEKVSREKTKIFKLAYSRFLEKKDKFIENYNVFYQHNRDWLDDFAKFMTFKAHFDDQVWSAWPEEIRDRNSEAIKKLGIKLQDEIDFQIFLQFLFFRQWQNLKNYCNENNIRIIGDIPYYVNYDSAEVWTNPQFFKLDEHKRPAFVAGVPPDYFSATGQLWGNPVYDWDMLQKNNYSLWLERLRQNLTLYDIIRIDHFRGFLAYWEVPASEETAENGTWVEAPADDLFQKLREHFSDLPILAEDLGVITGDVIALMKKYSLPGMRILMFAFDKSLPKNSYAPHNHIKNCVVYTGTHDNNTVRGWFEQEISEEDRQRIYQYLGREISAAESSQVFVRMALMSVADIVIIPMQDILGLGAEHRMNRPATLNGNWKWRLNHNLFPSQEINRHLAEMTEIFGRG